MLVCGVEKVYKYLEKNKVEKIYLTTDFNNKDILDLIKLINKDGEIVEVFYVERDELDDMTNKKFDEHQDIVAKVKNMIPFIIILIIATGLLLLITVGLSFSIFNINNNDKPSIDIDTGKIILNYSDVNGRGNGIYIENAMSITDDIGKNLTGTGNYFDFTVSGTTYNEAIRYYILLETKDDSTLDDKNVKVYLTKVNGTVEEEILSKTYKVSELEEKEFNDKKNKVIYFKDVNVNTIDFVDNYRLRMWISDDAEDYFSKRYSLSVNVYGEG